MIDLIILGGSRNVWSDYKKIRKKSARVMAINYVALHCPDPIHYIVSMHSEALGSIRDLREKAERNRGHVMGKAPIQTHGIEKHPGVDFVHETIHGGSSGLFAALLAVKLGYENIVLCGIPLDNEGNFYDPPWVNDRFSNKKFRGWKTSDLHGKITSMSGWTREYFGAPE